MTSRTDSILYAPRGLSRDEAARYVMDLTRKPRPTAPF